MRPKRAGGLLCALAVTLAAAPAVGWGRPAWMDKLGLPASRPAFFPKDLDPLRRTVRRFTAAAHPQATQAQARRYGLILPPALREGTRLVVLVHGLDSVGENLSPLRKHLEEDGYEVGLFCYPSDQPLADSAALLGRHMAALRETWPKLTVDFVAHSMGGLVCRWYVEGPDYGQGAAVGRLILLAPPNHGAGWTRLRFASELDEHWRLWRSDPTWRASWMVTDGLGEAGRDLRAESEFLRELNNRPRREAVKYTIVAGTQHPCWRITADCVERWTPRARFGWLRKATSCMRRQAGESDGPVKLDSARLEGVEDFVVVKSDHDALYAPKAGRSPAAWPVIRQRLEGLRD